jgi:hypothetical protein
VWKVRGERSRNLHVEPARQFPPPEVYDGCTIYPTALPDDHPMTGIMGGQWRWLEDMLEFFAWAERG